MDLLANVLKDNALLRKENAALKAELSAGSYSAPAPVLLRDFARAYARHDIKAVALAAVKSPRSAEPALVRLMGQMDALREHTYARFLTHYEEETP